MKAIRFGTAIAMILALSALSGMANAQRRGPQPPPPPPPPPFIIALDANADRVIDATEIANAATALLTLDANADGALTPDELCPPPPKQQGDRPAPPDGGRRPVMPILAALDVNADGTIDATEIANAPTALLTLDKNGDGVLTEEEFRPAPPPNGGPQGPRGHGGPGTQSQRR